MLTVLLGGARSGKSALAIEIAQRRAASVSFIATGEALDEEFARRIQAHREERPTEWSTLEEPVDLERALNEVPATSTVIVDCLTLWVSNLFDRGAGPYEIADRAARVAAIARVRVGDTIVVSNEVGSGIVPAMAISRSYRDVLGRVNALFVAASAEAYLVVAGRPISLSPGDDIVRDHPSGVAPRAKCISEYRASSLEQRISEMSTSSREFARSATRPDRENGRGHERALPSEDAKPTPRARYGDILASTGRGLGGALAFLTPIVRFADEPSSSTMCFFPLAGATIGLVEGALWRRASRRLPTLPASAITVVVDALVTGGLHLDGLADASDGLLAHRPQKGRLDIMDEPANGTFGTLALLGSFFLRVAALSAATPSCTLLATHLCSSRSLMVIGSRMLPYAKRDGLASPFLSANGAYDAATAVACAGVVLSALTARIIGGRRRLRAVLAGDIAGAVVLLVAKRRLGGFTGDILGAAGSVSEVVGLLYSVKR